MASTAVAPLTVARLQTALELGGSRHDATTYVDGLLVRVWWDNGHNKQDGAIAVYGWRWSVEGLGPDVWYHQPQGAYGYLAEHWAELSAEHQAAPGLRSEAIGARTLRDYLEAELAELRAENARLRRLNRAQANVIAAARAFSEGLASALQPTDAPRS